MVNRVNGWQIPWITISLGAWGLEMVLLHFQQSPLCVSLASSHSLWARCCWVLCMFMWRRTWKQSVSSIVSWSFFLRHSHIESSSTHIVICYILKDSETWITHTKWDNQKSASLIFAGLEKQTRDGFRRKSGKTFLLGTTEYVICRSLYVCSLFVKQ